jgi:hypothetical protein
MKNDVNTKKFVVIRRFTPNSDVDFFDDNHNYNDNYEKEYNEILENKYKKKNTLPNNHFNNYKSNNHFNNYKSNNKSNNKSNFIRKDIHIKNINNNKSDVEEKIEEEKEEEEKEKEEENDNREKGNYENLKSIADIDLSTILANVDINTNMFNPYDVYNGDRDDNRNNNGNIHDSDNSHINCVNDVLEYNENLHSDYIPDGQTWTNYFG